MSHLHTGQLIRLNRLYLETKNKLLYAVLPNRRVYENGSSVLALTTLKFGTGNTYLR